MDIGIVGLGRMGSGVATRLAAAGHRVVAYNRTYEKAAALESVGVKPVRGLAELVAALPAPRAIWFYLPAGEVLDEHLQELQPLLEKGDVVIDGGNSNYLDTLRRSQALAKQGIALIDVGTSGGVAGKDEGYCLMAGGDAELYSRYRPLWEAVAQPGGAQRVGPVGAGHYVKMVHNAIEYGMMQAYGEGMQLLAESRFATELDLPQIADLWQHGSIIRSFLGELLHRALTADPGLEQIAARVDDSGEGRWSVEEALRLGVAVPVIAASLFVRYDSRDEEQLAKKVVAILRKEFGGHAVAEAAGTDK